MKAILVIDMPDDMRIKDTKALHITLFNGLFTRDVSINCPLKPMDDYILCKKKQEVVERFPNGMMIVKEVYEPVGEEDVGTM